jgi:hypothetical protein
VVQEKKEDRFLFLRISLGVWGAAVLRPYMSAHEGEGVTADQLGRL